MADSRVGDHVARDLRRAAVATFALYVLQGLPLNLLMALSGISPADRSQERNLLGPYGFWTSPPYLFAVLLFGGTLAVIAVRVRSRSWATGSVVIVLAASAYVLPLIVAAAVEAGPGDAGAAVALLMAFTVWPFMSGWVAAGCAVVWFWRSRGFAFEPPSQHEARYGKRHADPQTGRR